MLADRMRSNTEHRTDESMRRKVNQACILWSIMAVAVGTATPALATGITERVSVGPGGAQSNAISFNAAISADGRFVAFESGAALVLGDTNENSDIFIRDRQMGITERVSLGQGGVQGNGGSGGATIGASGRFVLFSSVATNLVPGDTNGRLDGFVRDRETGTTERVTVGSGGVQGNKDSNAWAISGDGQFVAFVSDATNLVPNDTNGAPDVFIRNRQTGMTRRVSLGPGNVQGDGGSFSAKLSAGGRFVAFESDATNLVAGDTNGSRDIFVRDRQTATTARVSVGSSGQQGDRDSIYPSISADGRFVAFTSYATNLVPGDTNGGPDVFVHDRKTGTTKRISLGPGGVQGNEGSGRVAISADGRFVAFESADSNLVRDDSNEEWDIFVRDLRRGTTRRVSVGSRGIQGNSFSYAPAISADGQSVAFESRATNLVPNDTNNALDVFVHALAQ